jgi:hypothetical protein
LPRFEHRNKETPPDVKRFPKWMCACVTFDESPLYVSSYEIDWSSSAIFASNVPVPSVDSPAGVPLDVSW